MCKKSNERFDLTQTAAQCKGFVILTVQRALRVTSNQTDCSDTRISS